MRCLAIFEPQCGGHSGRSSKCATIPEEEAATWTDDEDESSTHSSCPSSDERIAAAPPAVCSSRSRALCDALSMS